MAKFSDFIVSKGIYRFPSGNIKISEQLDLGTITGLIFQGNGKSSHAALTNFDGAVTRLIWTGDPQVPMVKGVMAHFNIQGVTFVNSIFHIDTNNSLGSGSGVFEGCSFISSKVLFGNLAWNGNADQTIFRDCVFIKSQIQNTTSQNIGYIFENCQINRCPIFFLCDGGGKLFFTNIYVTDSPVIVQVKSHGAIFGSQNGTITMEDVDYDQKHTTSLVDVLVDDINTWYGNGRRLFLDRINFSPARPGITLRNNPATQWTVYGESTVFNKYIGV